MRKIDEIMILGKKFQVVYKKLPKDVYGETKVHDRTIAISSSLSGALLADTLLHETIHAILGVAGVSELLDERLEEAVVIALENGISQLYGPLVKKSLDK